MVYDNPHKLLTAVGTLWPGYTHQETWSFGLRYSQNPIVTTVAQANAAQTIIADWFDQTSGLFGVNTRFDYVKLATIDVDGKYFPGTDSVVSTNAARFGGSSSAPVFPGQIACAVSLMTALPRGRAWTGRFYLPPLVSGIGSDGTWVAASIASIATGVKNMLVALEGVTDMGTLSVMSKVGNGTHQDVTGIRIGVVPDTIRRRRNKLAENYQFVSF